VETQIAETLGATSFLRRRLDVGRVVFLGLRWGATVSALAAEREDTVSGLVLWSPIVSGSAYAAEIIRRKVFAQLANREGRVTTAGLRAALRAGQSMEFEGDYVTPRLFDDISAVELPPRTTRCRRPLFVGTVRQPGGADSPFESVVDSYRERGAAADLVVTDDPEYWDDRSMFGGFIPERLLDATLDWLRAHRASAA
jgi:pimeloyl-ACP methyl ester carboxylesterase